MHIRQQEETDKEMDEIAEAVYLLERGSQCTSWRGGVLGGSVPLGEGES